MSERSIELDEPTLFDDQAEAIRHANERAEHAEAELAKLKRQMAHQQVAAGEPTHPAQSAHTSSHTVTHASAHRDTPSEPEEHARATRHQPVDADALKQPPSPSSRRAHEDEGIEDEPASDADEGVGTKEPASGGEEELRNDSMMAYLLDSLAAGKDIGHYGRLVFAMVARHFMPHAEVLAWMMKDKDVDEEKAVLMLRQVEGRDYSPPRRNKILDYQKQQDFPILPYPDDPDCGNLYRNLKFPDEVYQHIGHYQEAKAESRD